MSTLFFRLLQHDDKSVALAKAVDAVRTGRSSEIVHEVTPESFRKVPGSPFAYWVSESLRELFLSLSPLSIFLSSWTNLASSHHRWHERTTRTSGLCFCRPGTGSDRRDRRPFSDSWAL